MGTRQEWTVEQKHDAAVIRVPFDDREGQEFRVLLTSDRHHDNPDCRRDMEYRHLDQAAEINAPVIDLGDLFCAMQGRNDRRGSKSKVRPEHRVGDYFGALIDTAVEDYAPWARQFAVIATGNHETAILRHNEIDLTRRLVAGLQAHGSPVIQGGYRGWVRFQFEGVQSNRRWSKTLYYYHGSGGGGPVTKGVIQTNRRAVYLPDANIVATGHIHESWEVTLTRYRLTSSGREYQDEQLHVQVPTYKDEARARTGWHVETGKPPKPLGARWLVFTQVGSKNGGQMRYHTERAH